MQTQIHKWGNSLGVRIPKSLASKLNLKQGVIVNLEVSSNYLMISPETSKLDLLLNQITDDNKYQEVFTEDNKFGNESW